MFMFSRKMLSNDVEYFTGFLSMQGDKVVKNVEKNLVHFFEKIEM